MWRAFRDEETEFYLLTHIFMPLIIAVSFFLSRLSFSTVWALKFIFCAFIMNIFQLYYVLEICLKLFVSCWGSKRFLEKFPQSNILISNNTSSDILLLSFRQLEEVQSSLTKRPAENVSAAHLPLITPFPWPQSLFSMWLLRSFPGFGRIGLIFWSPGYFE